MSKGTTNNILCIRCPKSCNLIVRIKDNEIFVEDNECRIGEEYAIEEIKNPMRIVSSTIRIFNAIYPRLPVRTSKTVPKNKIKDIMKSIKGRVIDAPVKKNQIIIKNIANTGVDMIAERNMEFVKK